MTAATIHAAIGAVSPWIARWAHLIPAGASVLDLACGQGRHTRFFAARGCRVTGIDRDEQAIATLAALHDPLIEARVVDLELEDTAAAWGNAARRLTGAGFETGFDAIVVTNYLHRPLLPYLHTALRPGGVLLYETFARGNEAYGKPSRPAFLLEPGELLRLGTGQLTPIAFEQGLQVHPDGGKAVVQRLAAIDAAAGAVCSALG